MTNKLKTKLAGLPKTPGVYFHKNKKGEIIYVGKAAVLRNRVGQYFQKSRGRDPKTDLLVAEIDDLEWIEVETELDALFLEAEMVRRYMPRYNILLRDDRSLEYARIDYKSDYPTVTTVRRPLDDGAEYFGPFLNGYQLRRALRYLRRVFPYAIKRPVGQKRPSLHYHLGLDPGLESGKTSLVEYRANLRKLIKYLKGERQALVNQIEREMRAAAKSHDFEAATKLRNQLYSLQSLGNQVVFSDKEFMDLSKDRALAGLCNLLPLVQPPRRIEGFDISHMQGTDTVASMVVFSHGLPDKAQYRKFKLRLPGNDDFAHMNEVLSRRLSPKNVQDWGMPGMVLIDGGKGQLSAALDARDKLVHSNLPMVGLAKREEEIVVHSTRSFPGSDIETIRAAATKMSAVLHRSEDYLTIMLPEQSDIVKLLQRIRDESHRFAVSYHSTLKRSRNIGSRLDEIPGIGPLTRKKLLKSFGSVRGLTTATEEEITAVIGPVLAKKVIIYLKPGNSSAHLL